MSAPPDHPDIRLTLLRILAAKEMYGYEILKKLQSERGTVHSGYLYGKLLELERSGFLTSRSLGKSKGPERKSYRVTEQGSKWLKGKLVEAVSTITAFYSDYLAKLPPRENINIFSKFITKSAKPRFVVVAEAFNQAMVYSLGQMSKLMEKGQLYIVKPPELSLHVTSTGLTVLDGRFSELPLRDDFADLISVVSPPEDDIMDTVKELKRVVKENGTVRISYPMTLVKQYFNEPLSFTDFVISADQDYRNEEIIDENHLIQLLRKSFVSVVKKQWMHFLIYEAMATAQP